MSVQSMSWALEQAIVSDPTARHVLLCLANYADKIGRAAFPSAKSLSADTGLAVRTVRYKLESLVEVGAIRLGNQAIAAAYIDRHDRRPVVYDLCIERGASGAPGPQRGASKDTTGCISQPNGVHHVHPIHPLPIIEPIKSPSTSETPDAPKAEQIQHEQIRELYNQILGTSLSRCMGLSDKHRKHIHAAHNLKLDGRYLIREGGLEFWEGLFNDVLDCPFLMGANGRAWKADFAFLTTASKIQSFIEGKYDDR